jgi:lambda family phage portal protein
LRFGFALEILDNDRIDFDYNKDLGNGKKIKNGIQFDEWGKPIKYFLIKNKDDYMGVNHLQVSAKDIIHLFIPYLPNQSRGITWLHSNIITMRHLSALTEAELIASRIAAAKMGVIKTQSGTEFKGDFEDEDGAQISELTPGTMFQLPVGTETQLLDPTHPNGNYAEFAKILLKKAASGLNVPYSSLTSDLREANYSSLRAGELDARDYYTIIQNYLKNHLMDDVLNIWLNKNNELQNVKLLNVKDIFSFKYEWQARRWPWVDPLKDVKAQIESNTSRLKTKKQIISEMGYDYQDMIEEFKNEIEIEKEIFSSVNNIEQEIDNNEDQSNNEEITNGTNEQELSAQSEPVEN